VNDNILNKIISGVIVGALLGLGTLFHAHLSQIQNAITETKATLRAEIREVKGDVKSLESRVREVEIFPSKRIR
jgi:hypothetical protein